jgi:hypothetical protein
MSRPARDIFLKINDKFSVGADSLQWIAYRTRGNRIIPVAFISSTKLILLRCLKEAGCDEHKTALALEGIPTSFKEWMANRLASQARVSDSI